MKYFPSSISFTEIKTFIDSGIHIYKLIQQFVPAIHS